MAAKILPEQSYLRECFNYNPRTGELRWKKRPHTRCNTRFVGKPAGYRMLRSNSVGHYIAIGIDGGLWLAHRIIWKWVTGRDPPDEIDHRDRDGTNNRWRNLRLSTRQTNMQNIRKKSTLPMGVSKNHKRFMAKITHNYEETYIGTFDTPEEAHKAYIAAKAQTHKFTY